MQKSMQCFFVSSSSLAACKRIEKTTRKPKHGLSRRNLAAQPSSQKESPRTFKQRTKRVNRLDIDACAKRILAIVCCQIWFRWSAMRTRTAHEVVALIFPEPCAAVA